MGKNEKLRIVVTCKQYRKETIEGVEKLLKGIYTFILYFNMYITDYVNSIKSL